MHRDPVKRAEYHKRYMRERYRNDPEHRERHKARTAKAKQEHKQRIRELLALFRRGGCALCSETDPCCLSAHHLDPQKKDFNIALAPSRALDTVIAELDKCICLCENCHRKVHAGRIDLANYVADRATSKPPAS